MKLRPISFVGYKSRNEFHLNPISFITGEELIHLATKANQSIKMKFLVCFLSLFVAANCMQIKVVPCRGMVI